ncbi:Phosphatidylinositolglycan class N-domain-containing protein [Zychaea mexicana]|uniref:Phosphatidylinositolglycan class N-domain-containing protein n=1 Tax=Zychaea mexicana TaxID=64656 RepID=UPI0022FE84F9|nr:Phosphatidylinositolglycan class N-domain-containing protein [Zychaea mexicana]KAI9491076.1 Phosphatidylinositolglycan class N-domain-containing protein [Zychaea mexicana]
MTPQKNSLPPPADRLVLFVGKLLLLAYHTNTDGLRADKVIERQGQDRAKFLRRIMKEEGTWGVSHTRVPTESRPGHVAIIAGFYEDVSAVTTGWTMNPVNFDSVFNQSRHTWSFGSPDILPMFQLGATDPESVETFMYPPEFEDFSGEASHLDTWVFDHVKDLFARAKDDPELNRKLRQDKIVFFLHLLGLDTNGHGFRPHSEEYHNNIELVDKGIAEMTRIMEDFYGYDGRTSYIFTADHGMNNRGGHGDGHPDCTRTPLVAWGAGIRGPRKTGLGHDDFSAGSDLSEWQRDDVLQADIAPLMSTLIGTDLPVNNVGELPVSYLKEDERFRAEAVFANAREILAQYQVKHDEKERDELFFRPFPPLSGLNSPDTFVQDIRNRIKAGEYTRAEILSQELIQLSLHGLRYFQTYDWLFLRGIITAGYVGWCVYCLVFVIKFYVLARPAEKPLSKSGVWLIDALSVSVFGGLTSMIWIQNMPPMYYAYSLFPVYFWNQILRHRNTLVAGLQLVSRNGWAVFILGVTAFILIMEALVYSFFRREVLSACFLLLSAWPIVSSKRVRNEHRALLVSWIGACLCTSVFTLLPVEKGEDINLVHYERKVYLKRVLMLSSVLGGIAAMLLSIALVYSTSQSIQQKNGLPFVNQILSWAIVGFSTLLPFVYRGNPDDDYLARLLTICLAFGPLIILLSISYEMLFYVCFCTTVLLWLEVEREIYRGSRVSIIRSLMVGDVRASLYFLFFINVAFFGTGNVASLSSFSLESVYRFVTIFNPFLMGALLIVKILVPFFVVSAVLGVLSTSLDLQPFSLFLAVMTVTDVQTINFFYFVSDYGSWLEIGTSISHFCIAELFIIFSIILFLLSRLLVGHLIVPRLIKEKQT